jgi:multiple sugar transport system substrate-binding protein
MDFIRAGTLSQVPEDLLAGLIDDCYEPVLGSLRGSDGRYYGVPLEFNNEFGGMFVNRTEFQRQGIAYPTTWDEIISVARRTAVRRGNTFDMRGFDFVNEDSLTYYFLTMILSDGGQYWANNRLSFTTPQAERALQRLVDWVLVDQITNVDGLTNAQGDYESIDFLGMNQSMMATRGPWAVGWLEGSYDKVLGRDIDYIKVPFPGSVQAFPAETGWSMAVAKNSRVVDAAWTFVRYFMMPDVLMEVNIGCAQIPPRKSIATNPSYARQMPIMAPILEILPHSKFIGNFNTSVLKNNLANVFVSLCMRDGRFASVSAALQYLERQVNTELRL